MTKGCWGIEGWHLIKTEQVISELSNIVPQKKLNGNSIVWPGSSSAGEEKE